MSIEVLTTKAANLPLIELNQSDNQVSSENNTNSINSLIPIDNQILNYNPEQFHNQGNSISSQIIESIASLDSNIKNMNKEISKSDLSKKSFEDTRMEPTQKTNLPYNNESYLDQYIERVEKSHQTLLTVQRTVLAVSFVQSLSTAFTKTLNKFLRM